MRKAWPILLLLAACGSRENEGAGAGEPPTDPIANFALPAAGSDASRLQDLMARAMPAALPDAKNAQYRNVRAGTGGSVCGEVAAKPASGGAPVFRPFVITPDALAVVGETPRIAFEDPADFLADAYIRWCATPEELQKLGPVLERARVSGPVGNEVSAATPSAPLPDLPSPPGPAGPSPAGPAVGAPPARTRTPAAPPPKPQIDSFFNSVQRNGQ